MPPAPFFLRYCLQTLAAQATARVQDAALREFRSRAESGELFGSSSSVGGSVELGIVAATKREIVGLLDRMNSPRPVSVDGTKFYSGVWNGLNVVVAETGSGMERARSGAETLLEAARPARVVAFGFATPLVPSLKRGAIFVPDRLLLEDGSVLDLTPRALASPSQETPRLFAPDEYSSSARANDVEDDAAENADEAPRAGTRRLSFARDRFAVGALATVAREKVGPKRAKRLTDELGASAWDRETRAIADVCLAVGVPFLPLRVIYDAASDAPSGAARAVAKNSDNVARALGAFFGATLKKPSVALDLCKMQASRVGAADKLADALEEIVDALASARPTDE